MLPLSPVGRRLQGGLLGIVLGLTAAPVRAQSAAPAQQPCTSPEYRQFDFWIGDWEVRDTSGTTVLGTNRIESILGGCALQEHWVSAGPAQTGTSFNTYYPPRKLWHQTWVDSSGGFLLLDGQFNDGVMTLQGRIPRRDDVELLHRISWSRMDGRADRVRQVWHSSTDGGTTWQTVFDGIYWRKN